MVEWKDFFPHRHRLSNREQPIVFSCMWSDPSGQVEYTISLTENGTLPDRVAVRESIAISLALEPDQKAGLSTGEDGNLDKIILVRRFSKTSNRSRTSTKMPKHFFGDLAQAFAYHLQPAYLKGSVPIHWPKVDSEHLVVPSQLGHEGGNLLEIIKCYAKADENAFNRFYRLAPQVLRQTPHGQARQGWQTHLGV